MTKIKYINQRNDIVASLMHYNIVDFGFCLVAFPLKMLHHNWTQIITQYWNSMHHKGPQLGKHRTSKTDEFLEKFRRGGVGGGSFPIQKFILQNLDL